MSRSLLLTLLVAGPLLAAHAPERFLGKTADQWRQALESPEADERRRAAFALGKLGARAGGVVPALKQRLQADADARVRESAAFANGEIARVHPALGKELDLVT